jgi:YD repeat-containing protein
MSIEIKITDKTNVAFPIFIKDKNGNEIYLQNENGYWYEKTYDDNNKVLTYKNSDGAWCEYTYNENGNELTCKNSDGYYKIKGKSVTKEEFEAFVNTPSYTMEELTAKLGHNFKIKQ